MNSAIYNAIQQRACENPHLSVPSNLGCFSRHILCWYSIVQLFWKSGGHYTVVIVCWALLSHNIYLCYSYLLVNVSNLLWIIQSLQHKFCYIVISVLHVCSRQLNDISYLLLIVLWIYLIFLHLLWGSNTVKCYSATYSQPFFFLSTFLAFQNV